MHLSAQRALRAARVREVEIEGDRRLDRKVKIVRMVDLRKERRRPCCGRGHREGVFQESGSSGLRVADFIG